MEEDTRWMSFESMEDERERRTRRAWRGGMDVQGLEKLRRRDSTVSEVSNSTETPKTCEGIQKVRVKKRALVEGEGEEDKAEEREVFRRTKGVDWGKGEERATEGGMAAERATSRM